MTNFSSASEKNVVPKFTIESVGHYIRYANIKVFSEPNFRVYKQNQRGRIREKNYQRKHIYLIYYSISNVNLYCIFYPTWRISLVSPQTYASLNKNNRHDTENN